jgi:hypothetical protein
MTNHQSRLQKVLELLLDQRRNPKRGFNLASSYGEERVYEGWLPIWAFQNEEVGGSSGGKRLRELRYLKGIPIEMETHIWERDRKIMRTPVYRLTCEPGEIDSVNLKYIPIDFPKKSEQTILELK